MHWSPAGVTLGVERRDNLSPLTCLVSFSFLSYAIMVSLYENLRRHIGTKAWRVAFVVVPVPVLIFVAGITLLFGSDHPSGKWSRRSVEFEITYDPSDLFSLDTMP